MEIVCKTGNSEKTLSFAQAELCRYLKRMLCREEGVFSVFLGVSDPPKPEDGFSVAMDSAGGTILGSNPRSVLLGVYDYLQKLGCRFLSPVKQTEVVPAVKTKDLAANYAKQASFFHRGVCIEGANSFENVVDFIDWLPKMGYNSFFLQFKVPYAFLARWYHHEKNPLRDPESFTMEDAKRYTLRFEAELEKRSLMLHKVGHGWTGEVLGSDTVGSWDSVQTRVSPEKRDMAAMLGGKRDFYMGVPANTNLCFSNPGAVECFAEQVVSYARENPAVDYLHIWLADEYNNVCECEACRETTVSDQYVELLNEIDRRLAREGLSTRLVFLLYQELLWPPVQAKLQNPDRFLLMFAPISRTFARSYDLTDLPEQMPQYVRNAITLPTNLGENLAFLRGWQMVFPGSGFVYDYPLGRAHYGDFGYLHIARLIGQDIKKLRQMGLDGYISCQELRASSPNMLPNYVMGKVLFDKNADVETLIREYYESAYPENPELVKAYLEQLSDLSSCDYLNGKGPRENPEIARRMAQIGEICRKMENTLTDAPDAPHWNALRHHNGYILRLSQALAALALGDRQGSGQLYQQMRAFICQTEPEYQSWLDVYRVLEVTQKYTGFHMN